MPDVRLIRINEEILSDNRNMAVEIRTRYSKRQIALVNLMSSPGSGKTSLILETLRRLDKKINPAVIEADLDSTVDADKIAAQGVPAVQIETGGLCHVSAAMMERALANIELSPGGLIILENIGNLICTAQSDTGAHLNIMILSVPEGDDKPLKYPLMFRMVDAVILNKIDYIPLADFNRKAFSDSVRMLNPTAPIFELSCRTGEGIEEWMDWIGKKIRGIIGAS